MIHTQVGLGCIGAKVNSRIVPLKYQLRNGDVVDIMTSPTAHPSRDWMNFAKTSRARAKIRHYLAESERTTSIELGKKLFEKEADRFRLNTKKMLANGELDRVALFAPDRDRRIEVLIDATPVRAVQDADRDAGQLP